MREIVLDTETTGLNPLGGDRLVEIGCVELHNHIATGKTWHRYFNPERDVPEEAAKVHGLTTEFLADKPLFAEEAEAFLSFIGEDRLVIHNAPFDMGFLNAELTRLGYKNLPMSQALDTLPVARQKFPGAPASLDALCRRFSIDSSARTLHGALLDAELLAEVYLELCGGRQPGLDMGLSTQKGDVVFEEEKPRVFHAARAFPATEEELKAHAAFLEKLKDPLWLAEGEK